MDDVAVALSVAVIQDFLHLQERLFGNERLVASDVQGAFVAHDAGVVRIPQDEGQTAATDGLRGARWRRPRGEAALFEHLCHLRDRIAAGGVLLEGPRHQRCAVVVNVDGVDQSPIEVLADVDVAELRASDRATLLDLVRHLDLDVLPVHADLDFIHDVGDGFHGIGHVALTKFLLGGDKAHASFEEFALSDGSVGEVSEHATAHVDHDELHLRMFFDVSEELSELGAFGDGLRGLARLDEFLRDCDAQLAHLAERLHALRRDAVAVLVEVCGGV